MYAFILRRTSFSWCYALFFCTAKFRCCLLHTHCGCVLRLAAWRADPHSRAEHLIYAHWSIKYSNNWFHLFHGYWSSRADRSHAKRSAHCALWLLFAIKSNYSIWNCSESNNCAALLLLQSVYDKSVDCLPESSEFHQSNLNAQPRTLTHFKRVNVKHFKDFELKLIEFLIQKWRFLILIMIISWPFSVFTSVFVLTILSPFASSLSHSPCVCLREVSNWLVNVCKQNRAILWLEYQH